MTVGRCHPQTRLRWPSITVMSRPVPVVRLRATAGSASGHSPDCETAATRPGDRAEAPLRRCTVPSRGGRPRRPYAGVPPAPSQSRGVIHDQEDSACPCPRRRDRGMHQPGCLVDTGPPEHGSGSFEPVSSGSFEPVSSGSFEPVRRAQRVARVVLTRQEQTGPSIRPGRSLCAWCPASLVPPGRAHGQAPDSRMRRRSSISRPAAPHPFGV